MRRIVDLRGPNMPDKEVEVASPDEAPLVLKEYTKGYNVAFLIEGSQVTRIYKRCGKAWKLS